MVTAEGVIFLSEVSFGLTGTGRLMGIYECPFFVAERVALRTLPALRYPHRGCLGVPYWLSL